MLLVIPKTINILYYYKANDNNNNSGYNTVYTAYFRCDISLCYENHGIEFRATKDRSN